MHGANAPGTSGAASRRSNVAPSSSASNVNVGVVSLLRLAGPVRPMTAGPVWSIVNVWLAAVASTLPAASRARTANVCVPSDHITVTGEAHAS